MSSKSLTISFEFFPPKTDEGRIKLYETAVQLADSRPDFFSVTFGAGGSTREGTLDAVTMLQDKTDIEVAPHLSCVGTSQDQLIETLHEYKKMGVKRIVALRGDIPTGMTYDGGELRYASDLVRLIRKITGDYFHIEVAAYPEIHPQAKSVRDDVMNLRRKQDAGADSAITQYFYNSDAYFYYLDDCASNGINIPIIPGVMIVNQYDKLLRFSEMCGADVPLWIRKRFEACGNDQDSIQAFGLEVVYRLCQRLIDGGAPGLHFYTLNLAEESLSALKLLGLGAYSRQLRPVAVKI
jgi:methylenetetrahydrofolate reductase (NADPH)